MKLINIFAGCLFAVSATTAHGYESSNYFERIQEGSKIKISKLDFEKIESNAWNDYTNPKSYEMLSDVFSGTTEKVWAIVYAETYCNMEPFSKTTRALSKRIPTLLQNSVSNDKNTISISLTKSAEVSEDRISSGQLPFETNYETSWALALVTANDAKTPSTLADMNKVRQAQIAIWLEKKLPSNEFINRLLTIKAAGHLEAYNYWLFASSFPKEFEAWKINNSTKYRSWVSWLNDNKFVIISHDFHRLTATKSLNEDRK